MQDEVFDTDSMYMIIQQIIDLQFQQSAGKYFIFASGLESNETR